MSSEVNNLYEFGEFCLDAEERVLLRGGEPIALSPKVFETLFLLVQGNGHIFSNREMMDALWADSFVEESNLTQNIYTLRRVLGTNEHGKRFIENVPRRGYRFNAELRISSKSQTDARREGITESRENISRTSQFIDRPRSLIPYLIGAIIVGVLGFVGFRFWPGQTEKRLFAPSETVNFKKLSFTGDLSFPVLAPDGNSFAFVRGAGLFVQDVNSGDEIRLNVADEKVFGILRFSADGNSIYFRNRVGFDVPASVFQVSRFGGVPRLVAENVWSGFGFSADARQMFFFRVYPKEAENALIIRNLETGDERKLTTCKLPSEYLLNTNPQLSPDGKKIAIVIFERSRQAPISQLRLVDVETGEVEEVGVPQLQQFEQVAWTPDGQLIISAREKGKFFQLWRLGLPGRDLQKITNDLNIYRGLSLSADGKKLLARQFTIYSHVWIAGRGDIENGSQKTFGNLNRDGINGIAWTPNGDIIYTSRIMADGDLWLYRPSDDSRWQLTQNAGGTHQNAIVSPDGRSVFFNTNRSGTNHIWRMDPSGANQTQITFGEKEVEAYPQISPDGAWLYYIQRSPAASTVWRKSLSGGHVEALTEAGKLAPDNFLSLSPDGNWLAFHNSVETVNEDVEKQTYQVGLIPTSERGAPRFLNITASRPVARWNSDSSALDYIENNSEGARIWRMPVRGDQEPTLVLYLPKSFLHNFAWSPAGDKLVLSRGAQLNDAILLTNFQP